MATVTESMFEQCSRVIRDDFALRSEPFTEIDVVNAIASQSWAPKQYKEALDKAQQVCASFWRNSTLIRFGPVRPPGQERDDFVRRGRGGKILYAGYQRVKLVDTANGAYAAITHADARRLGLVHSGRRAGIDRDDFKPWTDQQIKPSKDIELSVNGNEADLTRLRTNLEAANKENERLERENNSLRERSVMPASTMLVEIPLNEDFIDQLAEALLPKLRERLPR